jgi:DHA1 family solute carrier family 18 vesicular amine transporter 1/2
VRRAEILLYVLIVAGETAWAAFVPLGPLFEKQFDLTATQLGVLLGGASVAVLLVSAPAGVLADRLGARRLTVAGTVVMAAATMAQGVAPDFWTLLAARVAFGLGFGVLWSAGLALLAAVVPPERRASALSLSMTLAAVGVMAGPGYAGALVGPLGTGWPFALLGGLSLLAALGLVAGSSSRALPVEEGQHVPLRATVGAMRRDPLVLGALVCMAVPGLVNNGINLLLPLQLDDNGTSTAVTGLAFSVSAALFAVGSVVVARRPRVFVSLRIGAIGAGVLAAVTLIPLVATASAALIAYLLLRSVANALMFPIAMPLAVRGAERSAIGRGAVLGVLNAAWAASAFAGPIIAGAGTDAVGETTTLAVFVVLPALAAIWLARARTAGPVAVD